MSSESRDPLNDVRVQDAVRYILQGKDVRQGKRLMAEAGYPEGFTLNLLMSRFRKAGGSEGGADLLIEKLKTIGVRVQKIP